MNEMNETYVKFLARQYNDGAGSPLSALADTGFCNKHQAIFEVSELVNRGTVTDQAVISDLERLIEYIKMQ